MHMWTVEFVCYYLELMSVMFPNDTGMMLVKIASDFMFHAQHRHVCLVACKIIRNDPKLHLLDLSFSF